MRVAATAVLTVTALTCTAAPGVAMAEVSAADRAAITKVIKVAVATTDPAKACTAYTPALYRAMFATKKPCSAAKRQQTPELAVSIAVYSIKVSGKKATAKITVQGGDNGTGTWELARSGKTWQVSLIRADYWRSAFSHAFGPKYKSPKPDVDPFVNDAYRACGLKELLNRSDKGVIGFVYEFRAARNSTIGKAFSACTKKAPGGKSPFRTLFEKGFKQGAAQAGAPPEFAACVLTKMRSSVSEAMLINTVEDGSKSAAWAKLNKQLQTWGRACGKAGAAGKIRAPQGIVRPRPVH
jgi:hypothetical protein